MASKTELAWAAGFLDGEGTFLVSDNKHQHHRKTSSKFIYFRIYVTQKDVRVLRKLQKILGGKIFGPYVRERETYTEIRNDFQLNGDAARARYFQMKPYLSQIKTRQAEKALRSLENRTTEKIRPYRRK